MTEPEFPAGSEAVSRRWLPTNRYNLVAIQASRLIRPLQGYRKYYADVLDLKPGYVPLLKEPPAEDVFDYCARETPQAWPVLLELDLPEMAEDVIATSGMIPASRIVAVHCRTSRELEEIRQHEYENTVGHSLPFRASPHLFSGDTGGTDLTTLREELSRLPDVMADSGAIMRAADRLTGGLLALADHGPRESRFARTLLTTAGTGWSEDEMPDELAVLAGVLAGHPAQTTEERILHATIDIALQADESQFVPASFIDALMEQYGHSYPADQTGLKLLNRTQNIVRDPTGTPPRQGGGWPVAYGLLVQLLYRTLDRITGPAPSEALQPDRGALNIARFIAGLTRGRQRLDSRYRAQVLDLQAAEVEAAALSGQTTWLSGWIGLQPREPGETDQPLMLDSPPETGWNASGEDAPLQQEQQPEADVAVEATAAEPVLETAPTADDQTVTSPPVNVVELLTDEPLQGNQLTAALWLCLNRKWNDLISTEVRFAGTVQMVSPGKGVMLIQGSGVPQITSQVQVATLRTRLEADPITPEEDMELTARISGLGDAGEKPKRTRKPASPRKPRGKQASPEPQPD